MGTGVLLLPSSPSFPAIFHSHSQPQFLILQNPKPFLSTSSSPSSSHLPCCFRSKPPRWDPNAETLRTSEFGFGVGDGDGDGGDEDGGFYSPPEKAEYGFWEEVVDSIWFFKVLSSYGWLLPGIIFSMLLTGGPKAFLMAFAIPVGISAFALPFKKLWGNPTVSFKGKAKKKRQRSSGGTRANTIKEEERTVSGEARKRSMGYQSWVDGANGSGGNAPSFGGWEELEEEPRKFKNGFCSQQQRGDRFFQRKSMGGGRYTRRKGRGEIPLLLRLLVALFPFLGSWIKL